MAQLGVASRRESERMIELGRVAVNGVVVTTPGTKVRPTDRVAVDGRTVEAPGGSPVYVLFKPEGYVTAARDPEGRRTIYELLPPSLPFLAHVGRLDYTSEGVLLLTTDGDLAQALLRPDSGIPRTYEVKIRGRLTGEEIDRLTQGIPLDGRPTRPVVIERMPSRSQHDWVRVTLFEGRNRHVRRIFEAVGHTVRRLVRVSFAGVTLEGLRPGDHRPLDPDEIGRLRALL